MKRREFIETLLALSLTFNSVSNISFAQTKRIYGIEIYDKLIKKAIDNRWYTIPIGELIVRVGYYFLNTKYVPHTLEYTPEEVVINFTELDCMTYVENTLNIARQIRNKHFKIGDLVENIRQTRYSKGKIIDYSSRLHYTADWINENQNNGIIKDITKELGGSEYQFEFSFMSNHYKRYKMLTGQNGDELRRKISETEKQLNLIPSYILPINKIRRSVRQIEDGDIIAIATSTKGLDYVHIGFAFDGKFLHASSVKKAVVLDTTIFNYVRNYKKCIGISVLRATI